MAILVSIYRHADGGDSTNYGVTSVKRGAKMAIVLGVEGPYTDAEALTMSGVKLRLVRRNFNGELYIHAEPAALPLGAPTMSGGNFIYTTDSRFRAVCPYPIPVHDRIEAAQ
jgi:hypothetical protein